MEQPRLDKVALHRLPRCGQFQLLLGRQALAGPAREGVGLVETDVTDRLSLLDALQARQRHLPPAALSLLPVQWRLPAAPATDRPAVRQPVPRVVIATR